MPASSTKYSGKYTGASLCSSPLKIAEISVDCGRPGNPRHTIPTNAAKGRGHLLLTVFLRLLIFEIGSCRRGQTCLPFHHKRMARAVPIESFFCCGLGPGG